MTMHRSSPTPPRRCAATICASVLSAVAVALVVLTTNFFNLLDLRPGRSLKALALLGAALTIGSMDLDPLWALGLFAGALLVLLPGIDLVGLLVATQNLQGLLLPAVLVFVVLLVNDERLMGRYRNGRKANVLAWAAVGLVVVLDAILLGVSFLGLFGVSVT